MSFWADDSDSTSNGFYLTVYTCLSFGYVLFVAVRAAILYIAAFLTSRKVH